MMAEEEKVPNDDVTMWEKAADLRAMFSIVLKLFPNIKTDRDALIQVAMYLSEAERLANELCVDIEALEEAGVIPKYPREGQ